MLEILSIAVLALAVIILLALAIIDLKVRLLPNVLVLGFAMLGYAFHVCALFYYGDSIDLALGAILGGGSLLFIRIAANAYYKQDTMGLGDVKLMAAAGLWLGSYDILIALIAGALAGILHGGAMIAAQRIRKQTSEKLSHFSIPAGPGFIAGIVIAGLAKFWGLPHLFIS